jgi:signal peptidase I
MKSIDALIVGGVVLFAGLIIGLDRGYGTRGDSNVYSFEYRGKPAVIIERDVRWGPNQNFLRLGDGEEISKGTIVTDDGKKIYVDSENILSPRYTIRDVGLENK